MSLALQLVYRWLGRAILCI